MKTVALISGGKDSCYNMMQCEQNGHKIVALANLAPSGKDELDSYMYQTVGHQAIELYSQAIGLPIYRRTIQGTPLSIDSEYTFLPEDEVEDLYELLKHVKEEICIEAVSCGAIFSDYQRVRLEHVCARLGLTPLTYLWHKDQKELLNEMIEAGVHAIVIKVAALGLEPAKHLGKTLKEIYPHMLKMNEKYGLNICGEGGEYETFTLDCPLFKQKIVVDEMKTVVHSADAFAPVAYLNLTKMHCIEKTAGRVSVWALTPASLYHSIGHHLYPSAEATWLPRRHLQSSFRNKDGSYSIVFDYKKMSHEEVEGVYPLTLAYCTSLHQEYNSPWQISMALT